MTTHSGTGSFDLSALNNLNQNLTQYFWFEEGGEGSYPWGLGAHVTLYPQSDFTNPNDSNYLKGQNILINTDGFSLRNGTIPLMVLDNDSLDFNLITDLSQGTYVGVATFGANGATIGQLGGAHSVIDANGQRFYASDGTTLLANLGYGLGDDGSGGTSDAPYYTLGTRKTTSATYNANSTYNRGDTCMYNNELYVCTTDITTAEAWTAAHWTKATNGNWSFVSGSDNIASSECQAFGSNNTILGYANHGEGVNNYIGKNARAGSGPGAHVEGWWNVVETSQSHAEGYRNKIEAGNAGHAEGQENRIDSIGKQSNTIAGAGHVEGISNIITKDASRAGHAEGCGNTASGLYSHVEGYGNTASGSYSHVEGYGHTTSGAYCHVEGYSNTVLSSTNSHVEGVECVVRSNAGTGGYGLHAQNIGTIADGIGQTAMGRYNQRMDGGEDYGTSGTAFVIGNGTSDSSRSNAFTVGFNGDVNIASGAKYKINGTALSASDVGAVPTSRTVNSKALSSNITLTASDVGALATSGGNITGNLSYKSSTIDASLANNGVSSTQYPTTFNILDKSNRILTRKEAVIESNGNISAYWYVRNYNTSGTQVGQKGIKITMNKSGAVTYGVDEPSSFLSALSMNKYTRSSSGALDWSNQTDGDSKVIMKSALAFWNGCYSGTASNLSRCTQGQIIGRNQICYANSRVDTFSSGLITLSLATLGITTGAKPVGILLTPEYSSGVTMKYDYDGSSASGVKIYAYTANGSAYSGALRYFAVVFQNTWTST